MLTRKFTLVAVLLLAIVLPAVRGQSSETERLLVVHGGGGVEPATAAEFLRLAGGKAARLVVIPTASSRDPTEETLEIWRERGFQSAEILHTRDRKRADTAEFCRPLERATAVWFSGGSQSRIAAAYLGTEFEKTLYRRAESGMVIGGTSAGAAIQSNVMIASGKAKPVLTQGFDLLGGAIVDQHFLRRSRVNRLLSAVRTHPNRAGIGIDERTAVVVQGKKIRVVGESYVTVIRQSESLQIDVYHAGDEFEVHPQHP